MDYTWIFDKDKPVMWMMYNHIKKLIDDNGGTIKINDCDYTDKDLFRLFVNSGLWDLMH